MKKNVTSTLRALLVPAVVAVAGAVACASTARMAEAPVAVPAAATTPLADQRILGSADAQVMIIEFTDLQCPYCARFARDTWPLLRERYVDTGKVRFATRDLPLPMHEFAVPAAVAARCAGEQGRFWEFREALFAAQATLGHDTFVDLARKFDLDLEKFATCRSDELQTAKVLQGIDLARAVDERVDVGGHAVVGPDPGAGGGDRGLGRHRDRNRRGLQLRAVEPGLS